MKTEEIKAENEKLIVKEMFNYVSMNIPVIPCIGKRPLINNWTLHKKTTEEEIKKWYKTWPNMNIGLPLGIISGVIAIDIDGDVGIEKLKEISNGDLPATWNFQTPGGGIRYIYRLPNGVTNTRKYKITLAGEHNEVALLGDGQQTILPPSIHPNGHRYIWMEGKSYKSIKLADAPFWMVKLMTQNITVTVHKNDVETDKCLRIMKKLSEKCERFERALEIQKNEGLCEDEWFMWTNLLVSAGYGETAMYFSKLSKKYDERSQKRITDLIAKNPNGSAMIRCSSFGCDSCKIKRCFNNIHEDENGQPKNSPGSLIINGKVIFPPKSDIYDPYIKALKNVRDYAIDQNGDLCRYDSKGNCHIISNFIAKPDIEIMRDDGESKSISYRISGVQGGRELACVDVTASDFQSMDWIMKNWGLGPCINAGFGKKDECRAAIQCMAHDIKKLKIFTHIGWQKLESGHWVFLHSSGCIGNDNVDVEIEDCLKRYEFPQREKDIKKAACASISLLEIAPHRITVPILALCYLAPLNDAFKRAGLEPNFLLWLYGGTGTRKTTLSLLFLSHFGDFNSKTPPASFKDTANAIEKKAFEAKDVLLLIDDFHPESSRAASDNMSKIAQRVLRMYGDRIGRGRLTSSIELRKSFVPRGEAIVTGEDIVQGQSSIARFLGIELSKDDVHLEKLTKAQKDAKLLTESMSGYIEWLISQMDDIPDKLSKEFIEKRNLFQNMASHGRTAEASAWLLVAYGMMLKFFVSVGACDEEKSQTLIDEAKGIFNGIIVAQNSLVDDEKPMDIFLKILKELLTSGKVRVDSLKNGPNLGNEDFFPSGESIGWYDNNCYYLRPETVFNKVSMFLASRGQRFPISERALWKQLDESGMIAVEKCEDGKVQRCPKKTVPKMNSRNESQRLRLLHLKKIAMDRF